MRDKILTAIGDSIVFGDGNGGVSWVDYIDQKNVFKRVIKAGINGSTYSSNQDCFLDRLGQTEIGDITVLLGGINDYNRGVRIGDPDSRDKDTFLGGMNLLIEAIREKNPATKIFMATPMNSSYFSHAGKYQDSNEKNAIGLYLKDYVLALREVADARKVPVINLYEDFAINPLEKDSFEKYNCGDGLHPNEAGYRLLAATILDFVKER